MKIDIFEIEHVELMPVEKKEGVLYISNKYKTAIHLCACGCGSETVTPQSMWSLTDSDKGATLSPSIGNYSFVCKSHYWIRDSHVVWA